MLTNQRIHVGHSLEGRGCGELATGRRAVLEEVLLPERRPPRTPAAPALMAISTCFL